MLLDLADGGPGKLGPEFHKLRNSELRQPRSAPGDQLLGRNLAAFPHHDVGLDGLVTHGIRYADYRCVKDRRMVFEYRLHLAGRHVLTGTFDHVLRAVDELKKAVLSLSHVVASP